MEFLKKIFDAVANGAEKASVVDYKIFAIIAISLIVALGIGIAISYAFSGIAKLRFATKKISKLIQNQTADSYCLHACFSPFSSIHMHRIVFNS